jgi:cytochrome c556
MITNSFSIRISLFLALTALIGCSPSSPNGDTPQQSPPAAATPEPLATSQGTWTPGGMGHHWVQNQQLQALMKSVNAKTQANWPRHVPQDPEDPQSANPDAQMANAAILADSLADAAVQIPASVTTSKMSDADSAGFQAEANTLHRQAVRLGQSARAKNVEQMQMSLDAISDTCISCHSRYRDFSGQLRAQ